MAGASQHTINVHIGGKPYIVFRRRGGTTGRKRHSGFRRCLRQPTWPPYPMARLIDIGDETRPRIVSRLASRSARSGELTERRFRTLSGKLTFTYGSHYCSVDNRPEATTLVSAISFGDSRIRHPQPAAPERGRLLQPGPVPRLPAGIKPHWCERRRSIPSATGLRGGPDWCSAQAHLDAKEGVLWTTCQDNGLLVLKFENGVWPFPTSRTPPGEQN